MSPGQLWQQLRTLHLSPFERRLTEASTALWRLELKAAATEFARLEQETADLPNANRRVHRLRLLTSLGLWAIRYLDNRSERAGYRALLSIDPYTLEVSQFLANVFSITRDTSDEAAQAYLALLKCKPHDQLAAQITFKIIATASPSEAKLALLEQILSTLSPDCQAIGLMCRWAVTLHLPERAHKWAELAVGAQPSHREANRFLGLIAEQTHQWSVAARHYHQSGDWIRCLVAYFRAGDLNGAVEAATRTEDHNQSSPTFLYYAGWLAYRHGQWAICLERWLKLRDIRPTLDLNVAIEAVAKRLLHDRLCSNGLTPFDIAVAEQTGAYRVEVKLHEALTHWLLQGDRAHAVDCLQAATDDCPDDPRLSAVLHACHWDGKVVTEVTKSVEPALQNKPQFQALFHWLTGLHQLRSAPQEAAGHLDVALQERASLPWLGDGIIAMTAWATERHDQQPHVHLRTWSDCYSQQLFSSQPTVAQQDLLHVATSYLAQRLVRGEEPLPAMPDWLQPATSNPAGRYVTASWHAAAGQWDASIEALRVDPSRTSESLQVAIMLMAMRHALQTENWSAATSWAVRLLELEPDERTVRDTARQIVTGLRYQLWSAGDYPALINLLEYRLNHTSRYDGALHHDLALAHMHAALSGTGGSWVKTVGHWAVALTDELYWKEWRDRRMEVYGNAITFETMADLRHKVLPELLRQHLDQRIAEVAGLPQTNLRHCRARLLTEQDVVSAVRYALAQFARRSTFFPSPIRRLVSPLLVQAYGYSAQGREFSSAVEANKLSPHETSLIVRMFSALADAYALLHAKDYEAALQVVDEIACRNDLTEGDRAAVRHEQESILRLHLEAVVEQGGWQEAIELASKALGERPGHREVEHLLVRAEVGKASLALQRNELQIAIGALRQRRAKLGRTYPELDTLLGEALARSGAELVEQSPDPALAIFTEALGFAPSNAQARKGAAFIHHQRAMDRAKQGQFLVAEQEAKRALSYEDDPATRGLLGLIYTELAQTQARTNMWEQATEYARSALEYGNNPDTLRLLVHVILGHAGYLANRNDYRSAIGLVTSLREADLDLEQLDLTVDLDELLSGLHNDFGALLSRGGYYADARRQFHIALQYDPTNYTARRNLR